MDGVWKSLEFGSEMPRVLPWMKAQGGAQLGKELGPREVKELLFDMILRSPLFFCRLGGGVGMELIRECVTKARLSTN